MNRIRSILEANWAYAQGITGRGIGVAVLDTGIMPHPDFIYQRNRIMSFVDFTKDRQTSLQNWKHFPSDKKGMYDISGHGTHVAGIIGGNGFQSKGKYRGIAPGCHLVCCKVLDDRGEGSVSCVREAIDWVIRHKGKYNIRIINLSFGSTEIKNQTAYELNELAEKAWNTGLVVVAAAGNSGPEPGSITAPGSAKKIITVGGEETELGGGRGPTEECIMKPEIVAPSSGVVSCAFSSSGRRGRQQYSYFSRSGTSMAAPMVSGAVALLLEVRPQFTNKEVKTAIRDSADFLPLPKEVQGWGRINIRRLLKKDF